MEDASQTGTAPPAPGLSRSAIELLEAALRAVEAKDLATVLDLLDEDAVLIDPNYPTPRMVGRAAIGDGLRWAFGAIARLRFEPVHAFPSATGEHAALEVDCHHLLPGGRRLDFSQVFVADARDGRLIRLRAYQPNGPGGLVGLFLWLTRLARRVRTFAGRRRP
jgi:ketosteroid isomerase-like protein